MKCGEYGKYYAGLRISALEGGEKTVAKRADICNLCTAPILAPLFSNAIRKCSSGNGGRGGAEAINY